MNRHMTAVGMAAFCAIGLMSAQQNMSAQSKPAAVKAAPAKAAPAKAAPAKVAPAKAVPAKVAAAAEPAGSVTMTGCLEADGRTFMLTDIEGAQAPKGRSWKTGFVTKKSKDLEVVATSSVKLGDHIGHRISVSGTQDGDSHFSARSVKQLSASCS